MLPEALGDMEMLVELVANHNRLTAVPRALPTLRHLEVLNLSNNQIATLPEDFGLLPLVRLYLNANCLTALPESFGRYAVAQHHILHAPCCAVLCSAVQCWAVQCHLSLQTC